MPLAATLDAMPCHAMRCLAALSDVAVRDGAESAGPGRVRPATHATGSSGSLSRTLSGLGPRGPGALGLFGPLLPCTRARVSATLSNPQHAYLPPPSHVAGPRTTGGRQLFGPNYSSLSGLLSRAIGDEPDKDAP